MLCIFWEGSVSATFTLANDVIKSLCGWLKWVSAFLQVGVLESAFWQDCKSVSGHKHKRLNLDGGKTRFGPGIDIECWFILNSLQNPPRIHGSGSQESLSVASAMMFTPEMYNAAKVRG